MSHDDKALLEKFRKLVKISRRIKKVEVAGRIKKVDVRELPGIDQHDM